MLIISLLVYNQPAITKACVDSILANTVGDFKLVIVDNASTKDSANYFKNLAAQNEVKIVYRRNEDNLGYIKAHNRIFKEFDSDYFCVLNNDVVIYDYGWNEKFIAKFNENPKLAIAGPKQNFAFLNTSGVGGMRPQRSTLIDYIEGWCIFAKTAVIKENLRNLFDETYLHFAFCEDSDLSLRIRQLGYEIAEIPEIIIKHMHNYTFKAERLLINYKYHENNNRLMLSRRWKHYLAHRTFSVPYRILLKRLGANGDAFCIEPIARELKYKYPGCEIHVETRCPQWLQKSPVFTQIGIGLDNQHYDEKIDLDLSYEKTPMVHIVDAYARDAQVNLSYISKTPVFDPNLKWTGENSNTIVVNSEGSWACRTWDMGRWSRFIQKIKAEGYDITEVGVGHYLGIGKNMVNQLNIFDTAKVISEAKEFVCFDGGLLHIAQSIGTPSFSIWGCTCPMYRIHDWAICRTVWLDSESIECAGCHHWRISPRYYSECHMDKQVCTEHLSESQVWDSWKNGLYNNPTQKVKRKT